MNISGGIDNPNAFNNLVDTITDKVGDTLGTIQSRVQETANEKALRIREYRAEASRMASLANKRLDRLEQNGLEKSPAYQGYLANGGQKFSVRGKTYNEVQAEVARMKAFIDANTSTVRGVNNYLKEIAANTGIKYKTLTDLREKSTKFFELADKVEQYLRTVDDMATAIGYQKIWEQINQYTDSNRIDLASSEVSVEDMIEDVTQAIREFEKPEFLNFNDIQGVSNGWFELPKE